MSGIQIPQSGYRHIACLVDGSQASRAALGEAVRLSALSGARLSVLHADPFSSLALACTIWVPDLQALREETEASLRAELRGLGLGQARAIVLDGHPPAALCAWAREAEPDLIIAVERAGRLRRMLQGSIASELARQAPCSVLIIREGAPGTCRSHPEARRQRAAHLARAA